MRIITGKARGRKLRTLEGEATRPTSERAKEAVFSMIQFSIEGRKILDLFAGSGQMSLEALSRGAASAVAIDSSPDACRIIKENASLCGFQKELTVLPEKLPDALRRLRGKSFNIVFIDPPYAAGLIPSTLRGLYEYKLVTDTSYIVCESSQPEDVFGGDESLSGLYSVAKQARYGAASVLLLRPSFPEENEGETGTRSESKK